MGTPFGVKIENGFYNMLTPSQEEHALRANRYSELAATFLDHIPKNEFSSQLLTHANLERKAAGLVRGELEL